MIKRNTFSGFDTEKPRVVRSAGYIAKINGKFLELYMEIDRLCSVKFGVGTSGVTEYINRLEKMRFATGGIDVIPRLIQYRNLRNKLSHEAGAVRRVLEITPHDIKWLTRFKRELLKRRDPISVYLRCARRQERRKTIKRIAYASIIGIIAVLALMLYYMIGKG